MLEIEISICTLLYYLTMSVYYSVDPTTERNEIVAGAAVNDDDDETGTGNSLEPTTMLIFAISLLQAIHAFLQRQ